MGGIDHAAKPELLGDLELYPDEEVADVLTHVSAAIGDVNADDIDVEEQALTVTRDVLRGRARQLLMTTLGERLALAQGQLWFADEHHILAVSPSAAAALGYTPDELVGRTDELLRVRGHDYDGQREELYANGEAEGVLLLRHRDGSTVPMTYGARVFPLAGRRLRFSWTRLLTTTVLTTTLLMMLAGVLLLLLAGIALGWTVN